MDQKASQGLLRLGDDVLDECLMVPYDDETYEEKPGQTVGKYQKTKPAVSDRGL